MGYRTGTERLWHARLGTAFCVWLINGLWRCAYRDLGPFRAIRRTALETLEMHDETWGWTIEMQTKAVEAGLRWLEVPVSSGARAGGVGTKRLRHHMAAGMAISASAANNSTVDELDAAFET